MKSLPRPPFADRLIPPVTAITAYDYPTARLCDEAGVQLILVGDSLGMMVAGCEDTTSVTLAQMIYHTTIVRRGVKNAVVLADLPIHTYDTPGEALASARQLVAAGADAVKLEGGFDQIAQVEAITGAGIPLCAHLGMLPQRVREEGGYKKKGRTPEDAARLLADAEALDAAGACAIVLESMMPEVAEVITGRVRASTIGIGAGRATDGQVLVTPDLTGGFPWFRPPFAKARAAVADELSRAAREFIAEIRGA